MNVDIPAHEQTKFRLRLAGHSLAAVSKFLNVRPSTVTLVSQGYQRSKRVELEIALRLNTTPEQLYPDRYECREGKL